MCMLFALRGARLFFKPFALRHFGGDGHKMLRESRGDHRRLNLLTIFFHFRVTLTVIASGTVQHATLGIFSHSANYNIQVVHFFPILW